MLEEIALDDFARTSTSNQPLFRTDIDFEALSNEREQGIQRWRQLSDHERSDYKDQADFEKKAGLPDLKSPDLISARNFSLLRKEISERLKSSNTLNLLSIDSLEFDEAILELAESLENVLEIQDLYKIRKRTVGTKRNSGVSAEEAQRIKNCFSQGRELFLAGKQGSLMVKPLNFFYALTAYSYGVIILNNPIRYRKDMLPGSHGMAYLPTTIQAQFGGNAPKGTFSDLVAAFPTQLIKRQSVEFNIDCAASIVDLYHIRFDVSLGTLLSMIPEMSDYYKLTTGRSSRCHPLEITNANDPRTLTWEFHIGDGEIQPVLASIEDAFTDFERKERHGKTIVIVPASRAFSIKACIYTDLRGNLWFVENPFYPVILPEIASHFLITSMFSNIMRYRPDEWGSILLNEVSSEISLLTRHYFSSLQRKFLVVILRGISRYIPYAS